MNNDAMHLQPEPPAQENSTPYRWNGAERRQPDEPAEVRLTDETIRYLEERFASAVTEGITKAITEEAATKFWSAGLSALQKQAAAHTGRFVLGSIWVLVRKVGLFLLVGGLVYAFGGWSALSALFKTMFTSGGGQ